ncbi:MAG: hypothetical protein MJ252_21725, partial [archaeon]|nr:hypothetical protein [archaeon]
MSYYFNSRPNIFGKFGIKDSQIGYEENNPQNEEPKENNEESSKINSDLNKESLNENKTENDLELKNEKMKSLFGVDRTYIEKTREKLRKNSGSRRSSGDFKSNEVKREENKSEEKEVDSE